MARTKDLAELIEFISKFNPEEFSSNSKLLPDAANIEARRKQAAKIKGRLVRKKQMEETFLSALESGLGGQESVTITQAQIDELLANS